MTKLKDTATMIIVLFTTEHAATALIAFLRNGLGMSLFLLLESTLEKVVIDQLTTMMK